MQTARFECSNRAVMVIGRSFLSQKPLEVGRRLKCRNIVRRNYDRRILCDITTLFLLAAFNQEGSEAAQENVFLADLCGTRTCSINSSTTAETVTASTPVSRAICFMISALVMFCKFLSDKDKQIFELKNSSAVQRLHEPVYCIAAGRRIVIYRK